MKILLIIISVAGLLLTIIPSVLVFNQTLSMEANTQLMFVGMLLWFGAAPAWMKEQKL